MSSSHARNNEGPSPSGQKTYYPRQSHHNQQFRISDGSKINEGPSPTEMLSTKRMQEKYANQPIHQAANQAHIRTQANTFGLNSNSLASNSSQFFEQTQSSNGFGSTFLSANNVRQSNPHLSNSFKSSATQMKFGNVGQELLGGSGG